MNILDIQALLINIGFFIQKKKLFCFFKEQIKLFYNLDIDFYKEIYEEYDKPFNLDILKKDLLINTEPCTIFYTEGDYTVFSKIYQNFGRRP